MHSYVIGMSFFKENLYKLQDENVEHIPIGFEVCINSFETNLGYNNDVYLGIFNYFLVEHTVI